MKYRTLLAALLLAISTQLHARDMPRFGYGSNFQIDTSTPTKSKCYSCDDDSLIRMQNNFQEQQQRADSLRYQREHNDPDYDQFEQFGGSYRSPY